MTMPPDRRALKAQAREQLSQAQVSPVRMTALYSALILGLQMLVNTVTEPRLLETFVYVLSTLAAWVLQAGFVLYFMDLRQGRRAGYATLFDGFSITGKVVSLNIVRAFLILLWSMLLVIPGIVAAYRYRFALYDLYEDPGIDIMEALRRSCAQTRGWKARLFFLDLSYLGWIVLEALPGIVSAVILAALALGSGGGVPSAVLSAGAGEAGQRLLLPAVCGAWSLVVSLYYVPEYQWVCLSYFDASRARQAQPLL